MNHGKDISQSVQTLILAFVSWKLSGFLTGITCTETGKHEGWRAGIVVCMGQRPRGQRENLFPNLSHAQSPVAQSAYVGPG